MRGSQRGLKKAYTVFDLMWPRSCVYFRGSLLEPSAHPHLHTIGANSPYVMNIIWEKERLGVGAPMERERSGFPYPKWARNRPPPKMSTKSAYPKRSTSKNEHEIGHYRSANPRSKWRIPFKGNTSTNNMVVEEETVDEEMKAAFDANKSPRYYFYYYAFSIILVAVITTSSRLTNHCWPNYY